MICTILAGGYSASLVDLSRLPGTIIAVNDAALYCSHYDYAVSMDRMWAENRIAYLKTQRRAYWLRRSTVKNFEIDYFGTMFDCDHNSTLLSEDLYTLNGTHSGFCALNLAYHLRPDQLYLVGFDMSHGPNGEKHWYPPYPWKNGGGSSPLRLHEWSTQFEHASRQLAARSIRTSIVTTQNKIQCFKPVHPRDFT